MSLEPYLRVKNEQGHLLFSGPVHRREEADGFLRLTTHLTCSPAGYLGLLTLQPMPRLLQGVWTLDDAPLMYPEVHLLRYTLDRFDVFLHEVVIIRDADLIFSPQPASLIDLLKRFPRA